MRDQHARVKVKGSNAPAYQVLHTVRFCPSVLPTLVHICFLQQTCETGREEKAELKSLATVTQLVMRKLEFTQVFLCIVRSLISPLRTHEEVAEEPRLPSKSLSISLHLGY
jgi:hypothetical protein